ncbi:hypothetical protein [Ideonella livida]|uniref:Uncharacterized protein n=1 Tax=Ideonella livida TaxID=2707176 RepID=A0A7C9PEC7_9BURK|nr:hypothetical protein [Ideonella livida]NDY89716.1 hypothetical protein [Ideonella livida]
MAELISLPDGDWLGDHSESAWRELLESRGGCSCCTSPPCSNCTDPPTEQELNAVGFTYEPVGNQEAANG